MKKRKKEGRKNRKKGRTFLKILMVVGLFMTVFLLIVGLCFAIYVNQKIKKSVDDTLFSMVGSDSATKLYYYEENESGEMSAKELTAGVIYGGYRCVYVEYERIPKDLKNAFVSIEDKRFYTHKGVDWKRTLSAGVNYFLHFSDSFGGSTITQQLIKNVTDKDEYSFQRKIQEIFWALDLETKMDKEEILGLYLNIINLSQGCYGVQAASEYYFSKDVSELTLNECAAIAAITNNPSYYDPIRNPEHNRKRKDLILRQMYEQGYISYEEMQNNLGKDAELTVNEKYGAGGINSWYVDMVIEDVVRDLVERKGYSRSMANLMIYTGGLQIYTAVDPEIQSILEEYYQKSGNFYGNASGDTPQSSMIVIDPKNGDILGVAGAIGEKRGNRLQNFATQTLRPAGSVVKPLSVYAPALDRGLITWSSVYDDVPVSFGNYNLDPDRGAIVEPVAWPKNSNGIYRGLTNINYALEHSINTVTVKVLQDLGVEESFRFLQQSLGMESLIYEGIDGNGTPITDRDIAALALGQMNYGVTVKEITAAYSIFINEGIYNQPRSYYKVTDSAGSIVLENRYHGEAVISEESASVMTAMLENVIRNGTATSISLKEQIACAGKTGTTQNNYDRWFIGYTPYYIGGVWYGYEYPKSLSGSNRCLDIWDDVMRKIHDKKLFSGDRAEKIQKEFVRSEGIVEAEFCKDSGLLATSACLSDPRGDRRETGYFAEGTQPVSYCDRHVPVSYDVVSGGIVLEDLCPSENVKTVGLIRVERSFPVQVTVSDAQYVWRGLAQGVTPETAPTLPFFHTMLKEGEFCGISAIEYPYNRLCREHFNYFEWKEKQNNRS